MYLAPLNYDRFFKKVFSELKIVKKFLEDFLAVEITEIVPFAVQHKITDSAQQVEFDYRCKIDGQYVIIDMQQWYKADIIERFYLYHSLNTGLQLENLPFKSLSFGDGKERKIRDYSQIAPVLTLIWMADDSLGYNEDYLAFSPTPEVISTFIKNDMLWKEPDIKALMEERAKMLMLLQNDKKELPFLAKNKLIYLFQRNIIRNDKITKYFRWFDFAEKTRKEDNTEEEFIEYEKDEIFAEMMRRLNKTALPPEDWTYVTDQAEMWQRVQRYEDGVIRMGLAEGKSQGLREGKIEGKIEYETELVLKLHKKGKTPEEISDLTDISIEKIKEIITHNS